AVGHRDVRPADLGRFDVVLDTVGTGLRTFRRLLNPGGRMVTIAFDLTRPARSLAYLAAGTVHGRSRVRFFSGNPGRADFDDLARHVAEGKLRPAVDTVFPLEETAAAHRALEAGGVRGKYVVRVAKGVRGGPAGRFTGQSGRHAYAVTRAPPGVFAGAVTVSQCTVRSQKRSRWTWSWPTASRAAPVAAR